MLIYFHFTGLKEQRARYLRDLYVTLIDLQWRYVLAILFNACLISYLFFAIMWYWLMSNHGDFNHINDKDFGPCVVGVESFAGAILFSIETQTSIGYGWSYINSKCSGALILLFVQVIVGILMENLLLGFIFAKFAQPKRRQKTLLFSKAAVVNQEDGELGLQVCFTFMICLTFVISGEYPGSFNNDCHVQNTTFNIKNK